MQYTTDTRDSYDAKDGAFRLRSWAMFATGFALGLAVLHIGVTQPLTEQFARLQTQMGQLERGVKKLAGQTGNAAKTGELLAALAEQARQAQAAAAALEDIKSLEARLIDGQDSMVEAQASLAALADLRTELRAAALKAREDSADVFDAVDKLDNLQERMIGQYNHIVSAQSVLAEFARLRELAAGEAPRIAEARRALESLIELESRALAEQATARQAAENFAGIQRLHEDVIAGAEQAAKARDASEQLVAIKETILCGNDFERPERARDALDELIKIRERLYGQADSLAAAQTSLDGLLSLKDRVLAQTGDLADAVETLELTSDLHNQLEDAMRQFEGVRRWLVEIVLIEPTVERTMNALKPLADLANLRRLSPVELRQAAKIVAGERSARFATKPEAIESGSEDRPRSAPSHGDGPSRDEIELD